MNEIFERLNKAEEMSFQNWKTYRVLYNAELGKMQKRIEELEEALRIFAKLAFAYDRFEGDDEQYVWEDNGRPTIGDLRKARTALGEKKDG